MMKQQCGARRAGWMAVLMAGSLAAGAAAWGNIPVEPQVSGAVSAVEGTTAVTIDGQTYLIDRNSPAIKAIQGVHPGDRIGLILSGPVGASGAQVIGIVPLHTSK
jgi:hypothetical protein